METKEQQEQLTKQIALASSGSVIDILCPMTVNVALCLDDLTKTQKQILDRYSVKKLHYGMNKCNTPGLPCKQGNTWLSTNSDNVQRNTYQQTTENFAFVLPYGDGDSKCMLSTPEDLVVIPIKQVSPDYSEGLPNLESTPTEVCEDITFSRLFPIDLDFAVTVSRARGLVFRNIILAASFDPIQNRPFSYEDIYISLSRVSSHERVRLLLVGNTELDKWESLQYIEKMKPDPFSSVVVQGWSSRFNRNWENDEWSSVKTRIAWDRIVGLGLDTSLDDDIFGDCTVLKECRNLCNFLSYSSPLSMTLWSMAIFRSSPLRHTRTGVRYGGNVQSLHDILSCSENIDVVYHCAVSLQDRECVRTLYEYELKQNHANEVRSRYSMNRKIWENNFGAKQMRVYGVFKNYILYSDKAGSMPPELTWLIGPACSGKTELVRQIVSLCNYENKKCILATIRHKGVFGIIADTFDSVPALMLEFSFFDSICYADFLDSCWWKNFRFLMQNVFLIVLEDFFSCQPWQIATFSRACGYVTGRRDKPFGGIPTIACGDIRQNTPVANGRCYMWYIMHMCLNVWTVPHTKIS
jgi:hypothetical protein